MEGDARNWALNLKLHDPHVFGSLNIFKNLLSESFEPPMTDFRTLLDLLEIKKGKRKARAYAQHWRYLASCMVVNPASEFVSITILIEGLADVSVRNHMF